jgi:hypothetical protein
VALRWSTSERASGAPLRKTAAISLSAALAEEYRKGDKVRWKSHGGEAIGEVVKKITEDTRAAGREVRASQNDPQYLVRNGKSGGEAVHKPDALRKDQS